MNAAGAAAGAAGGAAGAAAKTVPNAAIATTPGILDTFVKQVAKANGWSAKHGEPALNTGVLPAIKFIKEKQPMFLQPQLIVQVIPQLPGLMGGYPQDTTREHGANIFMCVMFGLLGFGSLFIFLNNKFRRHNFWLNFGLFWFCAWKVIGFATRDKWSYDVTQVNMGIVSVVFTHVPQLILASINHVLAHRIFTWRHPETGDSWWLNLFFNICYFLVIGIIIMAIIGQSFPYVRIMTEHEKAVCQNVTMAAAILNLVYVLFPFQLIFTAYIFKPGILTAEPWKRKDVDRVLPPVYQANWVESTNVFYYVPRGAQHTIYRDEPAAKAIRIIPSQEPPAGGLHDTHSGPLTHPNCPKMLVSIAIVLFVSTLTLLSTCFRVAAVFGTYRGKHPSAVIKSPIKVPANYDIAFFPFRPEALWAFYGGIEGACVLIYLLARIDLRFYIPDMAKRAGANPHPYNGSEYNEPKQLEESF